MHKLNEEKLESRTVTKADLYEVHRLIGNATVSVDVSTGVQDLGNRLFAKVQSIALRDNELTIIANRPVPNFDPADAPAMQLLQQLVNTCVTDYEQQAALRREAKKLLAKLTQPATKSNNAESRKPREE